MAERKTRLSAKVRAALSYMVEEGLSRKAAAEKAGCSNHWLYQRLREPSVLAFRAELMDVLRSSEASRTIARAATLADGAVSEHVRLQANTWLGGLDGIAPIDRSVIEHNHTGQQPGMTLVLMQAPSQPVVIDQPAAPRIGPVNVLPRRVPHPSERQ
jgi:hypothetical protein